MPQKFQLDPGLQEFATELQWERLVSWAEYGSVRRAAEAEGRAKNSYIQALATVRKNAALRGYSPGQAAFNVPGGVPKGFVLRGQSPLVDADGSMLKRWDKTKIEGMDPDEARKLPDPKKTVKLSTMTDAEGRVITQWIAEKPEDVARERAWKEFAEELSKDITRVKPAPAPATAQSSSLLAGYPVGDHHMGMLAWKHETDTSYDIDIAEAMLTGAFMHLTGAAQGAETGVIVFLGDFLHYDSYEPVTPTSRNQLDADSRFPKMVHAAVRTMRRCIDLALQAHRSVHVIVEAGNHDLSSTIFLAMCLQIAYENEPRITVDISPKHVHYYKFGKVLLGTHHGHGTKMANLPLLMAADRPEDWAATQYRHWWTGHIHQSKVQPATSALDFSGVTVESFRVLPPADAWAHQKGYRPHRDMKAVVFHEEHGEVARHTVNPKMLED